MNLLDDFVNEQEQATKPEPNYNYTILLTDGTEVSSRGYVVIGHGFFAVARDRGVLYDVWPEGQVKWVRNHGPVAGASELN